ncbi:MAG: hypothetical protein ACRDGT_09195 [Candidatus Limnocylindria bacterium]
MSDADPRRADTRAGIYLFAHDLIDEGPGELLTGLRAHGLDEVVMAAAYHHSRDLFPHRREGKVLFLEGGTVYFHPEPARYADTPLRPSVAAIAARDDPLARLAAAAERAGLATSAWVVVCHNSRLGGAHPDCAVESAFGDRLIHSLCPSNPAVRAYAMALIGDVARYRLGSIKLEALSFLPFDHGYHHERSFVPLGERDRFFLGLCFCRHCLAAAAAAGVDGERLRAHVRSEMERVLASVENEDGRPIEAERLRAECDGELGRYAEVRAATVSSLAGECVDAVRASSATTRVSFIDHSGAVLGYATGMPAKATPAVEIGWRDGIAASDLAGRVDALTVLGYFRDRDRLVREVRAYREASPSGRLEVLLRPMHPDVRGGEDLTAKVEALRPLGVDLGFYHYGLMRLEALGWIGRALRR